jgi:hypothetical protein
LRHRVRSALALGCPLVRRTLASDPDPAARIDELLGERRKEIEEQAARLREAVRDLERREQILRDSRASLERLLRLGTSDLDSREAELVRLVREITEREERVRADEADIARRREELGAVELKRAAVERRERAVAEREEELGREAEAPAGREAAQPAREPSPQLAMVPGRDYRLCERELPAVEAGDAVLVDDEEFVVARTGPSPLPGDARRCAYLVRGPRVGGSSDGSS